MATETGLYVYQVSYTAPTGGSHTGSLTITSEITNGTNNGTISVTLPNATSPTLDYLDTASNTTTGSASNNDVYDSTLNVHNAYIGTVVLPTGYEGFLVKDTGNNNYYIFTTSKLPTADVGSGTARTVNVSYNTATTGAGANANWDTTTGNPYTPCFLAGTSLRTPSGDAAVESLNAGDLVITVRDGAEIAQKITWVGHRSVKPGDLAGDDAHPIRIKAGAFADNVPYRDLLVTAEHCIFTGGVLIPARLLVNGGSIVVDRAIDTFTYYHVELATHAILLAEGLTTESYLDTGNRGNFANADVAALRQNLSVNPTHKSWADAAAPLMVEPSGVEPVWVMLNARAQATGMLTETPAPALSQDADLRLVTAGGAVIRPLRVESGKVLFMLPAGSGAISLVSRTARPADTIAPYIDDRRELGVLVGAINLYEGRRKTSVTTHLETPELSGWFAPEAGPQRWTNGRASLPVAFTGPHDRAAILEIQICKAGPYLATEATPLAA